MLAMLAMLAMCRCLPRRSAKRGGGSLVVLLIHSPPEDPAAQRPEPLQQVIHVSEISDLDQVAVEVLDEEQPVAARRLLRRTDDGHALRDQIVVPLPDPAHVQADVRQAESVPHHRLCRLLRCEVENLDHRAAGNPDPADLAGAARRVHAEEAAHALGGSVGDADQRTAEYLPPEAHRAIEIRDGDPAMTERPGFHAADSLA